MPRLDMDTGAVESPAGRLSDIGGDIGSLSRSISAQANAAGGASAQDAVVSGCQVFAAALQGALDACGDDTGILAFGLRGRCLVPRQRQVRRGHPRDTVRTSVELAMSDYGMQVPDGDPGAIRSAAGNLKRLANSLDGRASAIRGEAGSIRSAWRDDNGGRAAAEARSLAHVASNRGEHIDTGASALKSFATELDDAQDKVRQLIAQARAAEDAAERHASRLEGVDGKPASAEVKQLAQTAEFTEAYQPLKREYDRIIEALERKARSTGGKLSGAVPGARKGMSAREARRAGYTAAAIRMPKLAATEGRRLADGARKYLTAGKQLPDSLLTQLRIGRRSAHFGTSFLERLGVRDLNLMITAVEDAPRDVLTYNEQVLGTIGDMLARHRQEFAGAALRRLPRPPARPARPARPGRVQRGVAAQSIAGGQRRDLRAGLPWPGG